LKFYNPNIFFKGLGLQLLKVVWITTSNSVENAYLLHFDNILQIQARWITRCEFAPVSKPNRTGGSGAAKFRSKSWNLGTQLPGGVPLSGAKESTHFATAPARNLHDKPILLGNCSGARVLARRVPVTFTKFAQS
jgi:hypothetical protein